MKNNTCADKFGVYKWFDVAGVNIV